MNNSLQPISEYVSLVKEQSEYLATTTHPEASVIIVAYNTNWDLIRCLESVKQQSYKNFETLVIDNGKNEAIYHDLQKFPIRYFRLYKNYLPSAARNVGIAHAKGDIVCFLDDDGLAHPDYVKEHIAAIRSGALGVRGKILPKTDTLFNHLAMQYNLGDEVIPSFVDMEGNSSFPRNILIEVRGFNPKIFASEGAELSYRIVNRFGNHDHLLYWPKAIIYHDYSNHLNKLIRKTVRNARMSTLRQKIYPDIERFIQSYQPFPYAEIPWPEKRIDGIQLVFLIRFQQFLYKWIPRWNKWVSG